jgi:hypothetical protein
VDRGGDLGELLLGMGAGVARVGNKVADRTLFDREIGAGQADIRGCAGLSLHRYPPREYAVVR